MPIYEYGCQACGGELEILQRISDPPETVCPTCHGALVRLVSLTSFQLKGSGWYLTDYARTTSDKREKAT
jgi:putative FmdB family regulatory protein